MMSDNAFPVRLAGQRLNLSSDKMRGITPSDITRQLRYQAAFPSY
jgi:hypothetical protein